MLIRHAEKPTGQPGDPIGVTSEGISNSHALTVRGWQRAGALAVLFAEPGVQHALAVPGLLACPGYTDGVSHRVHQTLVPLAHRLALTISELGTVDDPQPAAAAALSSAAAAVLICWDHHYLPALAALVPSVDPVPASWPDDRFDLVWVFNRVAGAQPSYTFSVVEQGVLGDGTRGAV